MLSKIKVVLGITTSEQDLLLETLIADAEILVESYVGDYLVVNEPMLEMIVREMVVERYNKLGAEGMTSEDIEGHSKSFEDNQLGKHMSKLDLFIKNKRGVLPRAGRMRTL